jgi:hypothetical protein
VPATTGIGKRQYSAQPGRPARQAVPGGVMSPRDRSGTSERAPIAHSTVSGALGTRTTLIREELILPGHHAAAATIAPAATTRAAGR